MISHHNILKYTLHHDEVLDKGEHFHFGEQQA